MVLAAVTHSPNVGVWLRAAADQPKCPLAERGTDANPADFPFDNDRAVAGIEWTRRLAGRMASVDGGLASGDDSVAKSIDCFGCGKHVPFQHACKTGPIPVGVRIDESDPPFSSPSVCRWPDPAGSAVVLGPSASPWTIGVQWMTNDCVSGEANGV